MEYATLCQQEDPDPPGQPLATHIEPFQISIEFPIDVEVEADAWHLRPHKSGVHRAAWRVAGMTARRVEDGFCEYPLVANVMEAAGLWRIKKYIQRWQATIEAQVAFRPIDELCTEA